MKLYGVQAHRSPGSNFGAASALLKWNRPCQKCGKVINFGTCKNHRSYEPKVLVFRSRDSAAKKARKLNEKNQANFISYTPVLVLKSSLARYQL